MRENPLLFRNLWALKLYGLWSPKSSKFKLIYNIYSKTLYVWFCCFTCTQLFEMFYIYEDFKELTSNAGVSLLYLVAIAKIRILFSKRKNVVALVDNIRKTELKLLQENDVEKKKILYDYIEQNGRTTKKFWMLTFVTISGFFVGPSLEQAVSGTEEIFFQNGTSTGRLKKFLVFSSWFPFDKYSNEGYPVAYAIQVISGTIGASYLGIWDTFIVALMIFAIGQLRLLQYSLRNLHKMENNRRKNSNSYLELSPSEDKINKRLINCIKHHKKIIRYVKDLDILISPVMFLDLLVCSLMLCAIGLQATLEGPSLKLGFTVEYLIAMLIQLFMCYWYANEVMLESLNVSKAAWQSEWYNTSTRVKKSLILLMMRSQRSLILTAGKFYVMSLQTFLLILRASYSYMALLRQVYGRQTTN